MTELVGGKIVDVSKGELLWSGDREVWRAIYADYGETKRYRNAWYRLPSDTIVQQVERFGQHKDKWWHRWGWRRESVETTPFLNADDALAGLVESSGLDPREAAGILGVKPEEW